MPTFALSLPSGRTVSVDCTYDAGDYGDPTSPPVQPSFEIEEIREGGGAAWVLDDELSQDDQESLFRQLDALALAGGEPYHDED